MMTVNLLAVENKSGHLNEKGIKNERRFKTKYL